MYGTKFLNGPTNSSRILLMIDLKVRTQTEVCPCQVPYSKRSRNVCTYISNGNTYKFGKGKSLLSSKNICFNQTFEFTIWAFKKHLNFNESSCASYEDVRNKTTCKPSKSISNNSVEEQKQQQQYRMHLLREKFILGPHAFSSDIKYDA